MQASCENVFSPEDLQKKHRCCGLAGSIPLQPTTAAKAVPGGSGAFSEAFVFDIVT